MQTFELGVNLLAAYFALGLLFAIVFVARGVSRIDPTARDSNAVFRVIILPGVAAFWPLLLVRWIRASSRPASPSSHGSVMSPKPKSQSGSGSPSESEAETDWTEAETTP